MQNYSGNCPSNKNQLPVCWSLGESSLSRDASKEASCGLRGENEGTVHSQCAKLDLLFHSLLLGSFRRSVQRLLRVCSCLPGRASTIFR